MANDLYGLARELRSWVRDYLETRLSTFLKVLPYSTSTSSGEHDKVQGYPTEGADEEKYDYEGRRLQPFGIRSRPPAGVYGVWVGARGRSGNGVILAGDSTRFGPSDLEDGEVAVYNKATGCVAKFDKNGKISITATSGQVVEINGSTYSLPQWDDFVTDFATAFAAVLTANYTTGALVPTTPSDITNFTTKLGATGYKSTKAKNG